MRWGILIVSLIFSCSLFAKVKIAIIDTGFCHKYKNSKIIVKPVYDATNSVTISKCPKNFEFLPRFHGEKVLKTFISNYSGKYELEIFPIVVFDKDGEQKKQYWEKAFEKLSNLNPSIVISAVGLINNNVWWPEIQNTKWFLSAARISPQIKKEDFVFPQNQFDKKNVYLFGSYFDGDIVDPGQFNIEKIVLFAKDPVTGFNGSSYAVANISAEIISKCDLNLLNEKCFSLLSKNIKTAPQLLKRPF